MAPEEMVRLVRKLIGVEYSEDEQNAVLERLEEALPHAELSDLIYWSKIDLTPEQIVEEALRQEAEYERRTTDAANDP